MSTPGYNPDLAYPLGAVEASAITALSRVYGEGPLPRHLAGLIVGQLALTPHVSEAETNTLDLRNYEDRLSDVGSIEELGSLLGEGVQRLRKSVAGYCMPTGYDNCTNPYLIDGSDNYHAYGQLLVRTGSNGSVISMRLIGGEDARIDMDEHGMNVEHIEEWFHIEHQTTWDPIAKKVVPTPTIESGRALHPDSTSLPIPLDIQEPSYGFSEYRPTYATVRRMTRALDQAIDFYENRYIQGPNGLTAADYIVLGYIDDDGHFDKQRAFQEPPDFTSLDPDVIGGTTGEKVRSIQRLESGDQT